MNSFRNLLEKRQREAETRVCVGLDPLPEKLPRSISERHPGATIAERIGIWMKGIVNGTAEYASMFKLQSAHWESIPDGVRSLADVVSFIHTYYPEIPAFLDCKRNDIGRTQERYREYAFGIVKADGMNFSPYMGRDCMSALIDEKNPGKALVGLCYTSNPDSRQVQDALMINGNPLWKHIAKWTLEWAEDLGVVKDAGLVMAAAYKPQKDSDKVYSEHLKRGREIVGNKLWFLIPGIGTQGGCIEETIRTADIGPGSIAISSSSEVIFASQGTDYAEAAGTKAKQLRDIINIWL